MANDPPEHHVVNQWIGGGRAIELLSKEAVRGKLSKDESRTIAANVAKLPELLSTSLP